MKTNNINLLADLRYLQGKKSTLQFVVIPFPHLKVVCGFDCCYFCVFFVHSVLQAVPLAIAYFQIINFSAILVCYAGIFDDQSSIHLILMDEKLI